MPMLVVNAIDPLIIAPCGSRPAGSPAPDRTSGPPGQRAGPAFPSVRLHEDVERLRRGDRRAGDRDDELRIRDVDQPEFAVPRCCWSRSACSPRPPRASVRQRHRPGAGLLQRAP